jgi:formylmethanofuran dehydrogenase subunit A
MKVILRNVNLFHPLEKIDEKQIDIIIVDGRISKIGRLTEEETVGVKVF